MTAPDAEARRSTASADWLPRPNVFRNILELHLEELDFLWELREGLLDAPDWTLAELAGLEERADAHLAGLLVGQGHAADLALESLGASIFGATAATLVLLGLEDARLRGELEAAFLTAEGEQLDGMRIALRHSNAEVLDATLRTALRSGRSDLRVAAADVLAFRRRVGPEDLSGLRDAETPAARALAFGALGRSARALEMSDLTSALGDPDRAVRRAALEAGARLGMPEVIGLCRRAAATDSEAVAMLGILGEEQDQTLLRGLVADVAIAPAALAALGRIGDPACVPFLLETMRDPERNPAAGAAFVALTGAENLAADTNSPPADDRAEEEAPTAQPAIDAERALELWRRESGRFNSSARWQAGRDVSKDPLGSVFRELPLAVRRGLYLRERARGRGPDIELEARARLQLAR